VQQIQTRLIEEVGADAVLIVFSRTTRRRTTTQVHTWGNALACRGLAEEAYSHFFEPEEEAEEEDDA
jgi:hypothetical protein